MYFLVSIGLGALLIALLIIATFLLRLVAQARWWTRLRVERYGRDAITGLIFATLALGVQGIAYRYDASFSLIIGLIGGLSIVFVHRWITALMTPALSFIFVILLTPITSSTYAGLAIYFTSLLIAISLRANRKQRYAHIALVTSMIGASLITYLCISALEKAWLSQAVISNTLALSVSAAICLTLFRISDKFVQSAYALRRLSLYAPSGYLRYALAQNEFAEQLKRNPIKSGLWVIFRISAKNDYRAKISPLVEQGISRQISALLPKNAQTFNISPQLNGFFLPNFALNNIATTTQNNALLVRPESDELAPLVKLLDNAAQNQNIAIRAGAVAYNWQSSSFEAMEAKALFALQSGLPNTLQFYDPQEERVLRQEKTIASQMATALDLDNFEIQRFEVNGEAQKTYLAIASNLTAFASTTELRSFLALSNWSVTFDRYMLSEALTQHLKSAHKKAVLIIFYAPLTNSPNYDFARLAERVIRRGGEPRQIVLVGELTKNKLARTAVSANFARATEAGFRVGVANPRLSQDLKVSSAQINLITPKTWVKGLGYNLASTIAYDIKNIEERDAMLSHGISQWAGPLNELLGASNPKE